jgi:uncharacterized glyoxalase superfamily protein PhnB
LEENSTRGQLTVNGWSESLPQAGAPFFIPHVLKRSDTLTKCKKHLQLDLRNGLPRRFYSVYRPWSSRSCFIGWARIQAACSCYDEPNNPMTFPAPVPEIPAANVDKAAAYYVNTLGFTLDWGDDQGGIAGISRGNCRLFITNRSFRESYGNIGPILFWLNLDSKAEVDELFAQWKAAQAKIVSEPEDKPWKLREFMAADLDGNLIRVFYDFRGDM